MNRSITHIHYSICNYKILNKDVLSNYSYSLSVIRFVLYKNYDASSFIINYVGVQIDKQVNSVLQNWHKLLDNHT